MPARFAAPTRNPCHRPRRLNAYQFLHEHSTYYGRRDLARHARRVFPGARLLDVEQLAVGGKRSRQLHRLARRVPLLAVARSETSNRALLLLA
jgi:hypothetical protein